MKRTPPAPSPARPTQRRGDERRERLLRAAQALLQTKDFQDITFVAVCKRAGIPHGSARYFYPDLPALLRGLLADLGGRHDAWLARPLPTRTTKSWQLLVNCLIDRSAHYQRRHPVLAKLTIGGFTPPELKRLDRDADFARARFLVDRLEEFFVLPRHRDNLRVAYYAIEVVDTAFMLSMRESGKLTAWWLTQAKLAATAVLAQHFGQDLPRRPRRS